MSEYDDIFEELKKEFSRIGEIRVDDPSHEKTAEGGRALGRFVDKMVDRAAMKLNKKQRQIEIGETVEKLFNLLTKE